MTPRAKLLMLIPVLGLAACNTTPPNDVAEGVGFGDYATYQQNRLPPRGPTPGVVLPAPGRTAETVVPPSNATDPLAARAAAAIDAAEAGPAAAPTQNNAAISDEQDFDAVAARETIETDAERRAQMQEQRVEVAPTELPSRPRNSGPNIIEFALATTHPVGQQVYRRSGFGASRAAENCLTFQSDDLAQQAFLAAGGPERDRQRLDPDGDGYACDWNPAVYRNAARSGQGG